MIKEKKFLGLGVLAGLFLITPLAFAQQIDLATIAQMLVTSDVINKYGVAIAAAFGLMIYVAFALLFAGLIQEIKIFKSRLAQTALALILATSLAFFGAIGKVVAGIAAGGATFITIIIFGVLFMGAANWARTKAFQFGYTGLFAITGEGPGRLKERGAWILILINTIAIALIGAMIGSGFGGPGGGIFLGLGGGAGLGFLWGVVEVLKKKATGAMAVEMVIEETMTKATEYAAAVTKLEAQLDKKIKEMIARKVDPEVINNFRKPIEDEINDLKREIQRIQDEGARLTSASLLAAEAAQKKQVQEAARNLVQSASEVDARLNKQLTSTMKKLE